jgi:uncharacterized protein YcbX
MLSELWRYPVKSMLGERLAAAELEPRGLVGDRLFAVCDAEGKLGSGKNTRRMRRMDGLFGFGAAWPEGTSVPRVTTPEGQVHDAGDGALDAVLSRTVGFAVRVRRESTISHFDDSPVHIVTSASLAWLRTAAPASAVDARRFRANLVIDAPGAERVEQTWIGKTLSIGDVVLRITGPTERCVMTTMAQADLPDDPAILRTVARQSDACFGVYAKVLAPGRIAAGDAARLGA